MKRLAVIAGILLLIIGLSICSVFYTSSLYTQANEFINNGIDACDTQNSKLLIDNAKKLSELWMHKQQLLSIFIRHDDLENVDVSIVKVKAYSQTNNLNLARSELLNLQFMLEHLYKHVIPSFENIF